MTKQIKAGQMVRVIGNGYNTCMPIGWESAVIVGTTFIGTDGKEHTFDSVTIVGNSGLIDMDVENVEVINSFLGLCEAE